MILVILQTFSSFQHFFWNLVVWDWSLAVASSSCIHHKYGEKEFLLHTPVFCEVLKPIYSGFCVGHRLVHGLCDRHVAVVQSCTWGLSFTGRLL